MISQKLIMQCDVCNVLFAYQTNRNISRTKSDISGKTIDGATFSFQEFFQIRQT